MLVAEVKTCKDDFVCPRGFLNLGDKECRGKCDQRECCEKGECLEGAVPEAVEYDRLEYGPRVWPVCRNVL